MLFLNQIYTHPHKHVYIDNIFLFLLLVLRISFNDISLFIFSFDVFIFRQRNRIKKRRDRKKKCNTETLLEILMCYLILNKYQHSSNNILISIVQFGVYNTFVSNASHASKHQITKQKKKKHQKYIESDVALSYNHIKYGNRQNYTMPNATNHIEVSNYWMAYISFHYNMPKLISNQILRSIYQMCPLQMFFSLSLSLILWPFGIEMNWIHQRN